MLFKSNSCGEFFLTGETKKENNITKNKIYFVKTGFETWARMSEINSGKVRDLLYPVHHYFNVVLKSNNYGNFILLKQFRFNENKKRNEYLVKFIDTNYETYVSKKEIDTRMIKDPTLKKIFGIACLGKKTKQDNPQLYAIWFSMLNRCYNKENPQFKWYGEQGVFVDEEWHIFENFLNDVVELEGYDKNKLNNKQLNLDKDKKQMNCKNKKYSKETCCWLSPKENMQYREKRE